MNWDDINKEIQKWESTHLKINPVFAQTQRAILKLIDYYWVSKYRDGENDSSGYKKGFYNVVEAASLSASKMIDLDTKDIKIMAENGQSFYPAWLYEKEFSMWAKSEKNIKGQIFGQFLNQIVIEYPKYGHLLIKKTKNNIHSVPIQNVICQPDAPSFLASDYLIEKHEYTPFQLRNQPWDKDKIEKVLEINYKKEKIEVYERYGGVLGSDSYNYYIMAKGYEEPLVKESIDKPFYKELKWDDVKGRALGRGEIERLFENQIAKNLFENLMRTGLRWTSKHIYWSSDPKITKNLMTDVENGQVMFSNAEIAPIRVEERNLPAYQFMDAKWNINTQERGFNQPTLPVGTGQRAKSQQAQLFQMQLAQQYYKIRRDNLGMFIKDILEDWILPSFKQFKTTEHSLMTHTFTEEELDRLTGLVSEYRFNQSMFDQIKQTGIPNFQERQVLKALIKKQVKQHREIKIPEDYYKDLKYKIKIEVTGESVDITQKLNAIERALVMIGQNPALLKDRNFRSLFLQSMELMGLSPLTFPEDSPDLEQMPITEAGKGGSVARIPAQAANPVQIATSQTL